MCCIIFEEAPTLIPQLRAEINRLQQEGKERRDPEVITKISELDKAERSQKFSVGDDFTLLGLQLDHLDLNPTYTIGEKIVSGLTLGLYALIRDCLHLRDDKKVTLGDVGKTTLAVVGFFATGTLAGLGYLAYKGLHAEDDEDNTLTRP